MDNNFIPLQDLNNEERQENRVENQARGATPLDLAYWCFLLVMVSVLLVLAWLAGNDNCKREKEGF